MAQSLHTLCESHRFVCAQQFMFVSIDDALTRSSQWSWVRHNQAKPGYSPFSHRAQISKPKSMVLLFHQCTRSTVKYSSAKTREETGKTLITICYRDVAYYQTIVRSPACCWNIFQLCRFILFL